MLIRHPLSFNIGGLLLRLITKHSLLVFISTLTSSSFFHISLSVDLILNPHLSRDFTPSLSQHLLPTLPSLYFNSPRFSTHPPSRPSSLIPVSLSPTPSYFPLFYLFLFDLLYIIQLSASYSLFRLLTLSSDAGFLENPLLREFLELIVKKPRSMKIQSKRMKLRVQQQRVSFRKRAS